MKLVDKVFEIVEDDEELLIQFPEMKKGVTFKVVAVDNDHADGITAVQIRNGKYIHINSKDSWFWCFYCGDTMHQLKEVEELASDFWPAKPMNTFDGMEITVRLEEAKTRVNGYEANLMQCAADYIRQLEKRLEFSDRAF
ncbi:inhibitor of host Lon protease [Edwardsiella phage PEi20]|uniref:Protease inhibitor n=1 Tax=Edwardsiella phage PEi20 TaxID=1608310 RepID=A0A0B6VSM5_9CAUD|nr:inhibitor of host Lon protease [Edwardsiella phage PEi20]BAQ22730.1 protease inhibitor [Edwardsiella phage PEi20]